MKKPKEVRSTFAIYTIKDVIGQGGSGIVYNATDDADELVAIKILDPTKATREKVKRFENEYRFCSSNRHQNIIQVFDHGLTDNGAPFFVMKLYDSCLRLLIGKLKHSEILKIFGKILDGLEAAHLQGVVHRDLKPENILIKESGKELVVTDFGIARFAIEDLYTAVETKDGTRLANFQYAAPEQRVRGTDVDHRADIYALGLMLNELFTGQLALGTNFKTIGAMSPENAFLDSIVDQMLQQDPGSRLQSIEDFKKELLAREAEFISRQKLSSLKETVIPSSEIDDPLIADPPRVVSVDWEDNVLKIKLQRPVNQEWIWALNNMGSHTSILGKGPEAFRFSGSEAQVSAKADEAQDIINYFKGWLPKANQVYESQIRREKEQNERREREALRQQIAKAEERANLLERLKI